MVDVFGRGLDGSVERGLVADGPVVPSPVGLQREVAEPEVTAHPDGVQQGLGDAGPGDGTRERHGKRLPGKGGDGIGILVDVLVAEVEGGGGDVHGLVGHAVCRRRSGEGARKRAFLQQPGGRQGLRDTVDDVGVIEVGRFFCHASVFIYAQK